MWLVSPPLRADFLPPETERHGGKWYRMLSMLQHSQIQLSRGLPSDQPSYYCRPRKSILGHILTCNFLPVFEATRIPRECKLCAASKMPIELARAWFSRDRNLAGTSRKSGLHLIKIPEHVYKMEALGGIFCRASIGQTLVLVYQLRYIRAGFESTPEDKADRSATAIRA